MKARNILYAASAVLMLVCCEDYTEHNFGTDGELYPITETSSYSLTLGRSDYATIAAKEENIQTSIELGTDSLGEVDSVYYYALMQMGADKCFNNMTPAASYLPSYIQEKLPYATDGAIATVTVKEDAAAYVQYPAYVRQNVELKKGDYLLVAAGTDSCLSTIGASAYCYPEGMPVRRFDEAHLRADQKLEAYMLKMVKEGDHFLIYNGEEVYLCAEDGTDQLYLCEDLGDLDDSQQAQWTLSPQDDGTYLIQNMATDLYLCWDAAENHACLATEVGESMTGVEVYSYLSKDPQAGEKKTTVKNKYVFMKKDGIWQVKDSYLDLPLTGYSSTNADDILNASGFNIVIVDMPSTLTYVWKLDASYGLRASAYANSTYNVTEAWAVSPSVDLTSAVAPCVLQFQQAQKYAGDCSQELTVWITADNIDETSEMDPENYSWEQLLIETYPDGSSWDYMTTTLDISSFVGSPNVHFAFKYVSTSSAAATWEIKNLTVKKGE